MGLSHIVAADVGVSVTGELLMAIPPEFLPKVVEGLEVLSENSLCYPIPSQGITNDARARMGVGY